MTRAEAGAGEVVRFRGFADEWGVGQEGQRGRVPAAGADRAAEEQVQGWVCYVCCHPTFVR